MPSQGREATRFTAALLLQPQLRDWSSDALDKALAFPNRKMIYSNSAVASAVRSYEIVCGFLWIMSSN